jgi:hypothetical protein
MGTYLTGTFNVIHNTGATDFNNFVYSAVYFNTLGTYTINGTSVEGVVGGTLEVIVDETTTTLNSGFLLLGNPIPPQTKIKTGLISTTGGTEHYQFVNIKTGLPTNG